MLAILILPVQSQANVAQYVLEGETKDAKLGAYVARVPDVTGDFADELVSGNHRWDGPAGVDCGRVLLFDGATGRILWTFNGEKAGGLLGHDVWGIRDVNGDGCGDVIASAYRMYVSGRPNCGKVYLLDGKTGAVLWTKEGEQYGDEFGFTLSSIPDIDGDWIEDVLVGAWLNDGTASQAGKVYIYSGKTGSLIRTHSGYAGNDRFGCSGAGFQDQNGDGAGDYVVGAQYAGPNSEGQAYLYSGKTGALLRTWTGERASDMFGVSVASVPDTDGDRLQDLCIGARDHDTNGTVTDAGRAYLYSTSTGALLHTFDGENTYDKFGRFGAGIPDMNGDGYGEVAVGAYYHHGGFFRSGGVYVYSGRTGKRIHKFTGEAENNLFGFAICGLNDVNGDGRGDLAVGAYQYRPNPNLTESYGRIYVYTQGLTSPVSSISAASGGEIPLLIRLGRRPYPHSFHRFYMVVVSISGNHPGFVVNSIHVPINFDLFTIASWLYANSSFLVDTYARTDYRGEATAYFRAPPLFLKGNEGLKLTFAYALIDRMNMASNPVVVDITP